MTTTSAQAAASAASVPSRRPSTNSLAADLAGAEVARFVAVALQFGLLVAIIGTYDLENVALGNVAKLAWGGFLVHHFLPARFRLPFFALLSVTSVAVTLPAQPAAMVLLLGMGLIALAHLPLPFGGRVMLIFAAASVLVVIRADWLPAAVAPAFPPVIWPILGSMFMFRLIVYLYDLRHRAAPFSLWHAIGYFFMLPNAALPLFPVVDYKTFCRSHFNDDRHHVYQIGVRWIFRGVVQLLLYQVVYLFFVVDPADAENLRDVAQYVLTTFLLYLRVSGIFHVIVGLLHMFGFNLPETHHLYYISGSFTDFWRRINIYWKDFLTKVVFYPVYFRLKQVGEARAMALATLVAFVATWLLHSYQWLWLLGTFPVTWQDGFFWLGLGLLVIVNMRWEKRRPPRRTLGAPRRSLRADLSLGLRTAGTFAALSLLWTVWNTPTTSLQTLALASSQVTIATVAAIIAVLFLVGLAAVVLGYRSREQTEGPRVARKPTPLRFWAGASGVAVASALILAVGREPDLLAFWPGAPDAITSIKHYKINRVDVLRRERGYYQNLGDAVSQNAGLRVAPPPRAWNHNVTRRTRDDFLLWELAPSQQIDYKGVPFTTNQWGLHDREYDRVKPRGTLRIALVGTSHEVGAGVPLLSNYENLTEDRLNRDQVNDRVQRYEILNFSLDGYPPLQKLATIDQQVFLYQPDLVLYAAHSNEFDWIATGVAEALNRGVPIPYADMENLFQKAGVVKGKRQTVARSLRPYERDIMRWIFRRIHEQARVHGARAALLLIEKAEDPVRPTSLDDLAALATNAGLPVVDLSGAFDGILPRERLCLAPWDSHPNELGHRLLADKHYHGLVEQGLLMASPSDGQSVANSAAARNTTLER